MVEWSEPEVILAVQLMTSVSSTRVSQELQDVNVPSRSSNVGRKVAIVVSHKRCSTSIQQDLDTIEMAIRGSEMQCCVSIAIQCIHLPRPCLDHAMLVLSEIRFLD